MNLHKQFVQLGKERRGLTNRLLSLLPEIFEKKIYLEHGCSSIVEYAGKFGGLSKGVVEKTLRLEKHLQDKPALKRAIKTEGIHKVAMVATPATQALWADKVENMSKRAVQELVKEVRGKEVTTETKCEAKPELVKIELDEELSYLFLKLKKQLKANSNKEVMKKLLSELEDEEATAPKTLPGESSSRYVPVALKKGKVRCEYPGCNRPRDHFHHKDRYAHSKNHKSIIPLCKVHHEFMHNGLINEETWQMKFHYIKDCHDQMYREMRQ